MESLKKQVLSVSGLNKRFFGALALDQTKFELRSGEIHALIGENGAGKSTFIKILAGVYARDGGEILIDGISVEPENGGLPIGFIHQDLAFAEDLSICENIAITAGYPRKMGLIDWHAVEDNACEIYRSMQMEPLDPNRLVSTLSVPEKAILSIVRTLAHAPKILILDEPTAALPEADSLQLFEAMKRLKAKGTSMIYVSHRLNELYSLADRVTVFRDGKWIATEDMDTTTPDSLVEHMLGKTVELTNYPAIKNQHSRPVLEVKNLIVERRGPISFTANKGEILGLVGLRGGGQKAIGRAIFGAKSPTAGSITLNGKALAKSQTISDAIIEGIVMLAGDRSAESVFNGMSLIENIFVNPAINGKSQWSLISPNIERRATQKLLNQFDIRPRNENALIDWLSGGNQQKVCIARWLEAGAKLIILEEPTAGIDIGAKLAIHDILFTAASEGASLIVVSTDLEEVAALCHRVIVVNRGKICGEASGADLSVEKLIALSSQAGRKGASTAQSTHNVTNNSGK